MHPYGLNERTKGMNKKCSSGSLFFPIPRFVPRSGHVRTNRDPDRPVENDDTFFDFFEFVLEHDLKNAFFLLRVRLNTLKKKFLKCIARRILMMDHYDGTREVFLKFVMDIIDTKLLVEKPTLKKSPPKNVCVVKFDNKALESINLSKIFHLPDVVSTLPCDLQSVESIPVVTYRLGPTIRNKILNYKDVVSSIYVDDEISFVPNSSSCCCESSSFCDPFHKHIITGDLRIVDNAKLRKLLTKGPNFREPKSLNFDKALKEITLSIEETVESLKSKTKEPEKLKQWQEAVLLNTKNKIKNLKKKMKTQRTNPVLHDKEVMDYLHELQKRFAIVTIDKAANNFAFVCKKFYVSKLLAEIGVNTEGSNTYSQVDTPSEEIVENNIMFCKRFGLQLTEEQKCLPIMYWTPKMHKTPIGARFIVASKNCSTKPLSKVVSRVFSLIFNTIESYHKSSLFYTGYNKFWVVQNSFPIVEKLKVINTRKKAKTISTFDFSTLYTTLPHNMLVDVLKDMISFVFKASTRNKLGFSDHSLYWTSKGKERRFFTEQSLGNAVEFLIKNCFFVVGNLVFKQNIGIPMGIDPAPFWANLFLYDFEHKFIKNLISTGSDLVFKFHSAKRFIDDLCSLNDGGAFGEHFRHIYPIELELKLEHQGNHASFLDLDITIEDGMFVYKLYDKRDKFPFFIVRMPHLSSNIPQYVFYGATFSELLRIGRCSMRFDDFAIRASALMKRMLHQGGDEKILRRQISKALKRYPDVFQSFGKTLTEIQNSLFQ